VTAEDLFEQQRPRLRAVAYRMLGSLSEADDAVQETWLRLRRADAAAIKNPPAYLATVVGRVSLNMLRTRRTRREDPLGVRMPDPIVTVDRTPESEAILADEVGLAMMVVLEALTPAERLSFVLHDLFAVPFDEIAPLIEKTPAAARQLASRGRRRVRGQAPAPDADLSRQREVVAAFFAAARDGDLDGLVAVLDPAVVLRSDGGEKRTRQTAVLRGAGTVAGQAVGFARFAPFVHPALVNGAAGVLVAAGGTALSVMAFTVRNGRILRIEVLADPDRLAALPLPPIAG
jgi:RNA polymerase sigma factor (sigma-70 family)